MGRPPFVIGIFDTGVDPGAAGLAVCPDGSPKVIDIHDCTGAGDVDMRERRHAEVDMDTGKEYIVGLTGKKLLLSADWQNPSKEYRVGLKAVLRLFEPPSQSNESGRKLLWGENIAVEILRPRGPLLRMES